MRHSLVVIKLDSLFCLVKQSLRPFCFVDLVTVATKKTSTQASRAVLSKFVSNLSTPEVAKNRAQFLRKKGYFFIEIHTYSSVCSVWEGLNTMYEFNMSQLCPFFLANIYKLL